LTKPEAFTDADSQSGWNTGARAWETFVESGADYYRMEVHGPALLEACAPVDDLAVLDLGCGQGYFSRELAQRGARVTGVDLSDDLIAFARAHEAEAPLGIDYRWMSAQDVDEHWPASTFHLVTACMALHDMAGTEAVLRSTANVLKPGGRFVFSVPHPCTDTPAREWERDADGIQLALKIDRYFESGPQVCHWQMSRLVYHWDTPYWRYTLAEWSAMLADAGFLIRHIHEPRPTAEQVTQNLHLDDCYRLPYFIIFDVVKHGR
jgi:2-polyprenyl-3-methyl-5-hydroxy-6-metoxy-1,4-benzoquinol methylase